MTPVFFLLNLYCLTWVTNYLHRSLIISVCLLLAYITEEQAYVVTLRLLEGKLKLYQNFDSSLLSPTFVSLLQEHAAPLYDHIEKLRVSHSSFEDWFSRYGS
jgi:hypothetical protein